jgi:hypothetical protein
MASRKEAGADRQAVEYGDQRVERGQGGETHQVASGDAPRLTTQQGIVVSDDQNSLRAGERGPGTPPPTSSRAARSCGSGPARPPSRSGPTRRRHPPAQADRRNHGKSGRRP